MQWVSLIAAVTTVVLALSAAVWTNDSLMGAALAMAILAVLTKRRADGDDLSV